MTTFLNEKETSTQHALSNEEEIQLIIRHWIRNLNIKLGWIHNFDKLVVNYVMFFFPMEIKVFKCSFVATTFFIFDAFRVSSNLRDTFTGHSKIVCSIDYFTLNGCQYLCSGSTDKTVRVWDIEANKQIQLFKHSNAVHCVKFSSYLYHNYRRNVICSASADKTICFWDFKHNRQLRRFDEPDHIYGIEFSPFNNGRYLCSGSEDKTIRLWDVETSEILHVFKGHKHVVESVAFLPLQSNNNDNTNKSNNIGGNGYTICSGSWDKTICIWDIETTKQLTIFKGHTDWIRDVKYGSNELGNSGGSNTILSGSNDFSARLWDIRSGQQIQIFKGHTHYVTAVEYSSFIVNNIEVGSGNSN
ncbi:hypothetical protein RFI_04059, partial [Reticulomyxa filosa]